MAAGCTVLKSTKVGHDAENVKPEQREGIAYSLPTAMIHIKAVLSTTDKTTTPTNNPPKKPDAPANPGDKSGGTNDTTRLSSAAAGTNAPAERAQTTSEANVSATGTGDADQQPPNYDVTVEAIYAPDSENTFLLNPKLRCTSDDTFQITVSNGLLTTISSTNTDQSGEVLVQLAKTGIEAFKLAAGFPSFGARSLKVGEYVYPKHIEVTFDPTDQTKINEANDLFVYFETGKPTNTHQLFRLTVDPKPGQLSNPWAKLTATNGYEFDGFFYRSVLPYTITLVNQSDHFSISKTFLLPNGAPILSWSPKRAGLVKCINHVTLENGTLKEVFVDKPSTALATVKVPLTILQSIVALPTDLIQLKFNYSSNNQKLLDSQKTELASMQALLEAQRKFLEFQATNSASAGGGH